MTKKLVSKKLELFNQTTLHAMAEENNISIVKRFTDESVKIYEADFGFAWGRFDDNDEYRFVYKTPNTPYTPMLPERKQRKKPKIRMEILFDNNVKKENYKSGFSKFLKSYLIIPINYGDHVYGRIVLCYKEKHDFSGGEIAFSRTIGNTIAQAITANWLIKSGEKARILAEKQKASEVFLSQEKLKNEFIANATHEIRTPLAIIKGNIELALLPGKNNNIKLNRDTLGLINDEAVRISDIVSDLALLTSRGGRGQTDKIIYSKVNLKSIIETVIKRLRTLSVVKNISVTSKSIPKVVISGNEAYLEKMFANLVKNSITYGKQDGHTVVFAKVSKRFITVNVQDDGIGVSKEDIKHVFERFYRGDKSHNSEGNRTGLGLAIVKWVAELHNGSVAVKSAPHKGSIFSVKLPIKGI